MPNKISFQFEDSKGAKSDSVVYVPTGATLAQYESFATTWVTRALLIAQGVIRNAKICIRVPIGSIDQTGKPNVNSDVEEVGEYIFITDNGFRTQFNLPGYDESDTALGSDAIDTTAVSPLALINAFTNGVTLTDTITVVNPVDIGGNEIASLVSARERYRNSGKRRS